MCKIETYSQKIDSLYLAKYQAKPGSLEYLNTLVAIGEYYAKRKILDSSFYYYYTALSIADSLQSKNINIKYKIQVGLANGFRKLKKYDKALSLYEAALANYQKKQDTASIIVIYNNIALVYKDQKKYQEAKTYYEKALVLHEKLVKNQYWYEQSIMLYNNLSNLCALTGDMQKSRELLEIAITFCEKSNNPIIEASSYINLAERYLALGLLDKVAPLLEKAVDAGKKVQALEVISEGYRLLSLYYEKKQDLQNALNYYKKYDSLSQHILNESKLKQIFDLENEYRIAQKDKEILRKQKELEISKHNQTRNYFLLWIMTSLFLVTLIGIRNLYLRNKRQQAEKKLVIHELEQALIYQEELKSQIEFQQRELLSSSLQKAQQHEAIVQIKEYVKKTSDSMQESIQKIRHLVNAVEDIEKDWAEFKLRFEKIHTNFFKHLQERFPELTQNDLRMCAFIKLQLDKKQIAALLNVTLKAVEISRYRLKKKLDLNPEDDLNKFIQNFD
ncbi:MAG: tetratricopeptide repeat protein [Bacteroidia bacterium]|nr:tetratricopeptide repeat protein [Bacteroidia bacterium]